MSEILKPASLSSGNNNHANNKITGNKTIPHSDGRCKNLKLLDFMHLQHDRSIKLFPITGVPNKVHILYLIC